MTGDNMDFTIIEDRCYNCKNRAWHTDGYSLVFGCVLKECQYDKQPTASTVAYSKPLADFPIGGVSNYETSHYFNCKRCGAVGQYGVCEYCGSAEE